MRNKPPKTMSYEGKDKLGEDIVCVCCAAEFEGVGKNCCMVGQNWISKVNCEYSGEHLLPIP